MEAKQDTVGFISDKPIRLQRAFPLAAVVGMDHIKQALLLGSVDTAVGGIAIAGRRGTAKSVMARGVHALMPPIEVVTDSFCNADPENPQEWEVGARAGGEGPLTRGGARPGCAAWACSTPPLVTTARVALHAPPRPRRPRPHTTRPSLNCSVSQDGLEERLGGKVRTRIRDAPFVQIPLGVTEDRLVGTVDIEASMKVGRLVQQGGGPASPGRGEAHAVRTHLWVRGCPQTRRAAFARRVDVEQC